MRRTESDRNHATTQRCSASQYRSLKRRSPPASSIPGQALSLSKGLREKRGFDKLSPNGFIWLVEPYWIRSYCIEFY